MSDKPEYISPEDRKRLVNQILICRQIIQTPDKQRSIEERQILKDTLNELGEKYYDLFYWMNNVLINKVSETILEDNQFENYAKYLEEKKFEIPEVKSTAGEVSLRKALLKIYFGRTSVLGILADLTKRYYELENLKKRAKSLTKGIAFLEDTEWGGEAVYDLLFPDVMVEKLAELEGLYFSYKVLASQFDAAHEGISRVLTLETDMPSDAPRRRKKVEEDEEEEDNEEVSETPSKAKSWKEKFRSSSKGK